ncbi:MAG: hypothetical protein BWX50_01461 [Euryarchaeota archaeon ADurb.Bin009]|nr:MAG: hypothetical protein BWX50_01461 [Euryarchaeota archaeon ADurb.Bin009]
MQPGDAAGPLLGDPDGKMGQLRSRFRLFLHGRGGVLYRLTAGGRGRPADIQDQGLPEHLRKRSPACVEGELIGTPPHAVLRLHRRVEGKEQFPADQVVIAGAQAVVHRIKLSDCLRVIRAEHQQGGIASDSG